MWKWRLATICRYRIFGLHQPATAKCWHAPPLVSGTRLRLFEAAADAFLLGGRTPPGERVQYLSSGKISSKKTVDELATATHPASIASSWPTPCPNGWQTWLDWQNAIAPATTWKIRPWTPTGATGSAYGRRRPTAGLDAARESHFSFPTYYTKQPFAARERCDHGIFPPRLVLRPLLQAATISLPGSSIGSRTVGDTVQSSLRAATGRHSFVRSSSSRRPDAAHHVHRLNPQRLGFGSLRQAFSAANLLPGPTSSRWGFFFSARPERHDFPRSTSTSRRRRHRGPSPPTPPPPPAPRSSPVLQQCRPLPSPRRAMDLRDDQLA